MVDHHRKRGRDDSRSSKSKAGDNGTSQTKGKKVPKQEQQQQQREDASQLALHHVSTSLECASALLVVGTYQGLMVGLVLRGGRFYLKFSTKHHTGSVSSVVANDRMVASCGTDEQLFLFTTKRPAISAAAVQKMREKGEAMGVRMADLGNLSVPSEVVCMQLSVGSSPFLFCGTVDGQLLVYRARDWALCTTMAVHDRVLVGIAVHPFSHGTLAVTVSADRSVAVLDLAKEKLLTKWKYFSASSPHAESGPQGAATLLRRHREEPKGVVFSPSGKILVVYSANAFQMYDSNSMGLKCQLIYASLQPSKEIHTVLVIQLPAQLGGVEVLLVGDESGALRCCSIPADDESVSSLEGDEALPIVHLAYPESVEAQLKTLPPTVDPDLEARRKTPLRHVSRIKAICKEGCTLFTMDARGVVMCWKITAPPSSSPLPFALTYVASAACQGRATCMSSLWL